MSRKKDRVEGKFSIAMFQTVGGTPPANAPAKIDTPPPADTTTDDDEGTGRSGETTTTTPMTSEQVRETTQRVVDGAQGRADDSLRQAAGQSAQSDEYLDLATARMRAALKQNAVANLLRDSVDAMDKQDFDTDRGIIRRWVS